MLKLTWADQDEAIYVNPIHITAMYHREEEDFSYTSLSVTNGSYPVKESIETILDMIKGKRSL